MEEILQKMTMMLQQLIQDSRARDDREAHREAREEQREAQREIREQLRAGELHSILSTILSHVKPPPSIPLASPVLSSSTPHSSDSMTSGSSQRSPQQRSPAKEAKLRAAFLDAVLSGDNFNIGELIVPFFSTELSKRRASNLAILSLQSCLIKLSSSLLLSAFFS
jgi:hypothetical protein